MKYWKQTNTPFEYFTCILRKNKQTIQIEQRAFSVWNVSLLLCVQISIWLKAREKGPITYTYNEGKVSLHSRTVW